MPGKQAKILSNENLEDLLLFAETTRAPQRNRVIVLLSVKAGLRAGEIACLTWPMVLTADGDVASRIELWNAAAKKGSGRLIPVHPDLRNALHMLLERSDGGDAVIRSERGGAMS